MGDEIQIMSEEELQDVIGGVKKNSGWFMTVNVPKNYLALRPQPYWDQYHEMAQLYPGYQVFTYGEITNGTGLNGAACTYRKVCYNGIWGWANAAYLY